MKILVTGAGGLVGTAVREAVDGHRHQIIPLSRAELDVTDDEEVRAAVQAHQPGAVVHCAGWTAVDAAEEHPAEAARVNVEGTERVARAAAAAGALMVYLSSDFVFDGRSPRPYRPDDPTAPLSVYGRTKLAGEEATRLHAPEHLIVRTGGLYGGGGRDFVDAILERARAGEPVRVVDDQLAAPTWSRNLAGVVLALMDALARGVWHVQDAGTITWYDFARLILREAGEEAEVEPVSSEAYGAAAARPARSVLDCSATEQRLGRPMMHHAAAVATYLRVFTPPAHS